MFELNSKNGFKKLTDARMNITSVITKLHLKLIVVQGHRAKVPTSPVCGHVHLSVSEATECIHFLFGRAVDEGAINPGRVVVDHVGAVVVEIASDWSGNGGSQEGHASRSAIFSWQICSKAW